MSTDDHAATDHISRRDGSDAAVLLSEIEALRTQIGDLQQRIESAAEAVRGTTPTLTSPDSGRALTSPDAEPRTRRAVLGLAGVSAISAVGASLVTASPARAADPDDVVKNTSNPVVASTTMTGAFGNPVMGLFNNGTVGNAGALYLFAQTADGPTVRADNDAVGGLGGVAVAANAPGGVDLHARGSGRLLLIDHDFGSVEQYAAGELHQSGGSFYAMVTPGVRRVVAAPDSAGALTVIDPRRVYDSRAPQPQPGTIAPGQSRVIAVADGRAIDSGAVTVSGVVPPDATAIVFNLTVVDTTGSGYLSVTPVTTMSINASTINWSTDDTVTANFSVVGLVDGRAIRVHCAGSGTTHFVVDVLGYHR
ncbi:MAG: hypothetical protein AB7L17_09630 [Ilumatobacteraceae bacterium]